MLADILVNEINLILFDNIFYFLLYCLFGSVGGKSM